MSRLAIIAILAVVALALTAAARPTSSLDGVWTGSLAMPGGAPGAAAGALAQSGKRLTGTLTLDAATASGVFPVTGVLHGMRAVVGGKLPPRRLRWKARFDPAAHAWRGPMIERGGGVKMRAVLVLTPDKSTGPACGMDYFASNVMPTVIDPICSQCHVPGGLAQAAPFKVTPGNPTATAKSAAGEVNPADPPNSKLVQKPLGHLGHGGGTRIRPGSVEEQTLQHWIALVTAPGCDLAVGGGGGGSTGPEVFANNCASCHGAGATGGQTANAATAPNIRCATRAGDAMRAGRGDVMPSFATTLSDVQMALAESFLGGLCDADGRPAAELWSGNCSTCHGANAGGGQNALGVAGPDIHCSRDVAEVVASGTASGMPAFTALQPGDAAALQHYLTATFCPIGSASGADLFADNCARCHGADARGVGGDPEIRCNRGIRDVVRAGRTGPAGTMPAFAMVDAEIALLQEFLVGLCPVGSQSGADLFASNCAGCHGADAAGTDAGIDVRCATRVADAMAKGRGTRMPSFGAAGASEVGSIQDLLGGLCDAIGRPGSALYVGNCSTCHGATAGGGQNGLGVHGPDIQCTGTNDYAEKVTFGGDGMPAFPALGAGDVSAIVAYVTGSFCSGN